MKTDTRHRHMHMPIIRFFLVPGGLLILGLLLVATIPAARTFALQTFAEIGQTLGIEPTSPVDKYPFCDPEQGRLATKAIPEISTETYQGNLTIQIPKSDSPPQFGGTSISVGEGVTPEAVLQQGIAALHDPATTFASIDYSSWGSFLPNEKKGCLEYFPMPAQYLDYSIDIWDETVMMSVGGEGTTSRDEAELKALALQVLDQELQEWKTAP